MDGNPRYEQYLRKYHYGIYSPFRDSGSTEYKELAGGKTQYRAYRLQSRPSRTLPISERAWTFQEAPPFTSHARLCPPDQVYWCCGETEIGCGGLNGTERLAQVREDCKSGPCIWNFPGPRDSRSTPRHVHPGPAAQHVYLCTVEHGCREFLGQRANDQERQT